jgi:hypothetical protein
LWDPKTIRKNAPKKEREGRKKRKIPFFTCYVLIGPGKVGVAPQLRHGNPKASIGVSAAEMLIWKSLHCNRTTCIYIQVPIT